MLLGNAKAATLIETIIALIVFSIAVGAVVGAVLSSGYLIDQSRNTTVAVADLTNILEKIRATAFGAVTTRFPDAVQDGPAGSPYSSLLGGYNLLQEHITISYADSSADPLEIQATLTWQDQKGRIYSTVMSTFRTR